MKARDLLHEHIGILTVIAKTDKTKYAKKSVVWLCECECGNKKEYSSAELLGDVRSCGCLQKKNKNGFGARNKGRLPVGTLPLGESVQRTLYRGYQNSAKRRDLVFSLSEYQFRELIFQNCFYCDSPPFQIRRDRHRPKGHIIHGGIDRKDNTIGYTPDNCVPCCKTCNRAKDIMPITEFKEWITRVYSRLAS